MLLAYIFHCYRISNHLDNDRARYSATNRSVVFLKEREIILTSETWRVAIDISIVPYEDAISIIKEHLLVIEKHKQEFTPISELKTINTLLVTLQSKLQVLNKFCQNQFHVERYCVLVELF
jgi:hypothetical protein